MKRERERQRSPIQQLRALIQQAERALQTLTARHHLRPAPGSQAATELEEQDEFVASWSQTPVSDVFSIAQLRLAAARDQLKALGHLLSKSVPFGSAAVARAAIETAARAWYLLDPDIDTRSRVGRGMTARLLSLQEAGRLNLPEARSRADEVIETILEGARELDFTVVNRPRRVPAIGESQPSTTDLVRASEGPDGELLWRDVSAVTHGELWGVLGRMEVKKDPLGYHENLATPRVSEETLIPMVAGTLRIFGNAVARLIQLMGWDAPEWEEWRSEAAAVLVPLLRSLPTEPQDFHPPSL